MKVAENTMSFREAAAFIGIDKQKMRSLMNKGIIKGYKRAGYERGTWFMTSDVEELKSRFEEIEPVVPKRALLLEKTGKEMGVPVIKGKTLVPKEVAAFLRISERKAQQMIAEGKFPVPIYPFGPKQRICDSEDVNDLLSKIRVEACKKAALPKKAIKEIQEGKEASA